jgi:hypothetical protein
MFGSIWNISDVNSVSGCFSYSTLLAIRNQFPGVDLKNKTMQDRVTQSDPLVFLQERISSMIQF